MCYDIIAFWVSLTPFAEDWKYSSLYRRQKGTPKEKKLLAPLPTRLPANYLASVNEVYNKDVLTKIRYSVNKSAPFGGDKWTGKMISEHKLESTQRGPGRPKKR